jgi:hypothetical protein
VGPVDRAGGSLSLATLLPLGQLCGLPGALGLQIIPLPVQVNQRTGIRLSSVRLNVSFSLSLVAVIIFLLRNSD